MSGLVSSQVCSSLVAFNTNAATTLAVPDGATPVVVSNYSTTNYFIGQENFNKATGIWTCPVTGLYQISAAVTFLGDTALDGTYSSTQLFRLCIGKNDNSGVDYRNLLNSVNVPQVVSAVYTVRPVVSGAIFLNRGDTIRALVVNTTGAAGKVNTPYLSIVPVLHSQVVTSL